MENSSQMKLVEICIHTTLKYLARMLIPGILVSHVLWF